MKTSLLILSVLLVVATGCSMCCGPFDYDYPAFGGKHPRAVRNHGRVGSILSDPLTSITGESSDSNLAAPPEPLDTTPEDLIDTEVEDLNSDDDMSEELRKLDEKLEGIEPLRNNSTNGSGTSENDNNTASSRWKPRPLRKRIR